MLVVSHVHAQLVLDDEGGGDEQGEEGECGDSDVAMREEGAPDLPMELLRATLRRPLEVERCRVASPPMAKTLQNSATEAATLAARYWVSIRLRTSPGAWRRGRSSQARGTSRESLS